MAESLSLTSRESDRLHNRLLRIVCSEPWHWHLYSGILRGDLPYKPDGAEAQAKALRKKAVYPPGGLLTKMVRCATCRRWYPPQAVGSSGECIDCFYNAMPLEQMVQLPSSPVFHRMRSNELPAHFEGSGYSKPRRRRHNLNEGETIRMRYLGKDGHVHEPFRGEDGFLYENVYEVVGVTTQKPEEGNATDVANS